MAFETELRDLREHFLRPHNVGEINEPDAVGEAGSFACGGMLRVSLRIDDQNRIADLKFRAIGCSLLVSGASLLTESVKGKTVAEAAALAQSATQTGGHEGETPPPRTACVKLCRDALLAAIQHFSDSKRALWNGDDALICSCFGVAESTIEHAIAARNLTTIAEVTRACRAGAGCRSCYSLIEDILRAVNSEP
ncbi:MAG: NifU-like protein [Blastocatellia bacterium]|jgi:NifU-like protein|nr:NifU-like protein [Blastocatellia bacterium]